MLCCYSCQKFLEHDKAERILSREKDQEKSEQNAQEAMDILEKNKQRQAQQSKSKSPQKQQESDVFSLGIISYRRENPSINSELKQKEQENQRATPNGEEIQVSSIFPGSPNFRMGNEDNMDQNDLSFGCHSFANFEAEERKESKESSPSPKFNYECVEPKNGQKKASSFINIPMKLSSVRDVYKSQEFKGEPLNSLTPDQGMAIEKKSFESRSSSFQKDNSLILKSGIVINPVQRLTHEDLRKQTRMQRAQEDNVQEFFISKQSIKSNSKPIESDFSLFKEVSDQLSFGRDEKGSSREILKSTSMKKHNRNQSSEHSFIGNIKEGSTISNNKSDLSQRNNNQSAINRRRALNGTPPRTSGSLKYK